MPSTPLMASSSGVATVSAITLGLAPGTGAHHHRGGTTSGYSEIGSAHGEQAREKISTTAPREDRAVDEEFG
jgi:hypothetical protein